MLTSGAARSYREEISAGWLTLVSSMIAYGSGSALFMYTSNFFVSPIQEATGWARGEIALGVSLTLIANALSMPFIGKLADRLGPRMIGVASLIGYGCGCLLLGIVPFTLPVYYGLMLLVSPFFAGTSAVVFTRLITSKFVRLRGTALAVMLSGTALLLVPLAPLMTSAVSQSYRYGFLMLGAVALLIGLPLALVATRRAKAGVRDAGGSARPVDGLTWQETMRTLTFWQIVVAILASALGLGGILNQLSPVLTAKGLSPAEVTGLASLFVISVTVGRILVGALLDLLNPALVSGTVMILAAMALLLLNQGPPSLLTCAIFVILAGSAMGAEADFAAFFTARYFGQANYSAILGTISMFIAFGLAGGAYLYGTLYDRFAHYDVALQISMGLFLVSGAGLAALWRRKPLAPRYHGVAVPAAG